MLEPATREGSSPSAALTSSFAVLRPFSKAFFMIPLSFSSTSSLLQFSRFQACVSFVSWYLLGKGATNLAILGHLQPRNSDATTVRGLAWCVPDTLLLSTI